MQAVRIKGLIVDGDIEALTSAVLAALHSSTLVYPGTVSNVQVAKNTTIIATFFTVPCEAYR